MRAIFVSDTRVGVATHFSIKTSGEFFKKRNGKRFQNSDSVTQKAMLQRSPLFRLFTSSTESNRFALQI